MEGSRALKILALSGVSIYDTKNQIDYEAASTSDIIPPSDNSSFYDSDADPEYLPEKLSEKKTFTSLFLEDECSADIPLQMSNNFTHIDSSTNKGIKNKSKPQIQNSNHNTVIANNNKQTSKRGTDFCFYCESNVLNFARHIRRSHYSEIEVQRIFSKPVGSQERKHLIAVLRKRGNFLNNTQTDPKPVKKANFPQSTKLLPCSYCLGYYSSKQLWRHRKKCMLNPDGKKTSHQTIAQNFMLRYLDIDQKLKETVFRHMRADEIALVAKSDRLICAFGARYLKIHRENHFIQVTSRKMRELAKLLIEIKKLEPSVKTLFHALQPKYFDLFVQAAKAVAKYDENRDVYISPTYAINISTSLKQCSEIAIMYALKKKDIYADIESSVAESDLKTFIQLLTSQWRFEVSSQATNDLNIKKWNKITIVPLATDLKLLKDYLLLKAEAAFSKLISDNNDQTAYNELLETVFCRVLLLNRRRPGELERLFLHYYEQSESNEQTNYDEFDKAITITERILLKKFKRVIIRGKRGRGVPVLFSLDIQKHIALLLQHKLNFTQKNNPYLFARCKSVTPICGYKVLQKYAKSCGAKYPDAITSTRLRKHLATLTQMFNMSKNDLEQLCVFMGHTSDVQKKSYRLPDDIYQTAKISKLLILMENGLAADYKGKSLDEIDLNLEEDLLAENSNENEEDDLEPLIYNDEENNQEQNNLATTSDTEEHNSPIVKKKRILVPWSMEQKDIVIKYFAKHILKKVPPKKGECETLIKQHKEVFANKPWQKIKVFVQNIYTRK